MDYSKLTDDQLRQRYAARAHAMQSGVAAAMQYSMATEPKHLRVGVNAVMSDVGGLVTLLIAKGVFTEREYLEAINDSMDREVEKYEAEINARHPGVKITLH